MSDLEQMKDYCQIHREHIMAEVKQLIDSGDKSIKNDLEKSLSRAMADVENRLLNRMDDRFKRFDEKQDIFNSTLNKILWILVSSLFVGVLVLIGVVLGRGIDFGVIL